MKGPVGYRRSIIKQTNIFDTPAMIDRLDQIIPSAGGAAFPWSSASTAISSSSPFVSLSTGSALCSPLALALKLNCSPPGWGVAPPAGAASSSTTSSLTSGFSSSPWAENWKSLFYFSPRTRTLGRTTAATAVVVEGGGRQLGERLAS